MRTLRPSASRSLFRYSPIVAALACAFAAHDAAGAIMVTNTADSGAGSLRNAILAANTACFGNLNPVIAFAIPGSGPFVIAPSSALPQFNCGFSAGPYNPTLDATTQAGWSPNTLATGFNAALQVELSGASMPSLACGLDFPDTFSYGGRLTLKGLVVRDFNYGGSGTGLCGNLTVLGSKILNNGTGVESRANSAIGDATPSGRNVIAGNLNQGIHSSYSGQNIQNNFIGTQDGSTASPNGTGVYLYNGGNTIGSNVISGNTYGGVYLVYDGSSSVTSNKIGTDATGQSALGNGRYGVYLDYTYGASITGNTISGNGGAGVHANHDGGSSITGNYIGTNAGGSAAIGNDTGVQLDYSYGSAIKGTYVGGNTISGSAGAGIELWNSTFVTVSGNNIGTTSNPTAALPNQYGISGYCGANLTLTGNTISGNSSKGVWLSGFQDGSYSNNYIGTAGFAPNPLPNGYHGVLVDFGDCGYTSNNNSFAGNQIAYNGGSGILLLAGTGNQLSQNRVYANAVKNIDINNTVGPLPNDPGDADTGPNNQQNYPTIDSVVQSGGNTTISFTLDSAPLTSTVFHIEIFENPAAGAPAGQTYRADTFLPIGGAAGPVSGSFTLGGLADHISLTASNQTTLDTSEFSPIVSVVRTPAVTVAPTSLNFTTVVGATSPSQSVTLTSNGTAPYVINTFDSASTCYGGPFCYGGDFTCSTTCSTGVGYAPGTGCSFSASFHPSFLGTQSTTVYICDNATGSRRTITLTGDGVVPPTVAISPDPFDFGNVLVGVKSPPQTFTVRNPGSSPTAIGTVYTTGDFSLESTDCGPSLSPGQSCSGQVSFVPLQQGFTSGEFRVPTPGTPKGAKAAAPPFVGVSAKLYGTGVQFAQLVLPDAVVFGGYTVGTPTVFQTIELRNSGNAVLTFSSISATAPFTVVNNCPLNLAPGASCSINVGFSSSTLGDASGTLTIVSNAAGGSRSIPISARAQAVPLPVIRVSPVFIGFGDRMIGTPSATQRITIRNEGGGDAVLALLGPESVSLDYLATSTCGLTLAPQQTCFADVAFRPLGFGPRPGQFRVFSNASGSPHIVELIGTGCRPFVSAGRRPASQNCAP